MLQNKQAGKETERKGVNSRVKWAERDVGGDERGWTAMK
jgi:hypothetical protein